MADVLAARTSRAGQTIRAGEVLQFSGVGGQVYLNLPAGGRIYRADATVQSVGPFPFDAIFDAVAGPSAVMTIAVTKYGGATSQPLAYDPTLNQISSGGVIIPQYRPFASRLSNLSGRKLFSMPMGNIGSGYTFQEIYGIPFYDEPIRVRYVYENDTTTAYSTSAAAFSSGRTREVNPKAAADGSDVPWTTVAGVTVPAANASVATNDGYGYQTTAWARVKVQPRTDGKRFGLLYGRTYYGATGRGVVGNAGRDISAYSGLAYQQEWIGQYQFGDFTSANQTTFAASGSANGQFVPGYIQIMSAKNVITLCTVGDSTSQGLGTTSQHNNYTLQFAEANSSPQRPIEVMNYGKEGEASGNWLAGATTLLADANRLPTVMILQVASQNDSGGFTQSNVEVSFEAAVALAYLAISKGIVPILRTSPPTVAIGNSTAEAARLWVNKAVRSCGLPIFDYDAILSDGGAIARIRSGLSDDGTHGNDAGHAAGAVELARVLTRYSVIA